MGSTRPGEKNGGPLKKTNSPKKKAQFITYITAVLGVDGSGWGGGCIIIYYTLLSEPLFLGHNVFFFVFFADKRNKRWTCRASARR